MNDTNQKKGKNILQKSKECIYYEAKKRGIFFEIEEIARFCENNDDTKLSFIVFALQNYDEMNKFIFLTG